MKRLFLAATAASLLVACSVPRQAKEGGTLPGQHVDPTQRVLVLAIKDGQEQGEPVAAGSGQGLVDALRRSLATHQVPLSATPDMTLEQGFADAERGGFTYVLKGTITHWEDNATAWSGKGDKLNISTELYDVRSRTLVTAATDKRTATGFTMVSGTPDRFMDEVANGALSQIYGWPIKN